MQESIPINFRYTKDEYLRAVRFHYSRTLRVKLDVAVAILAGIAGIYLLYTDGLSWIGLSAVIACCAMLLIVFVALVIAPNQAYRGSDKLKHDYHLTFGEDGIQFRTSGIDSRLDWDIYDYWIEGPEFFILYYGKNQFSVIPKRAFQSDTERKRFADLLSAKVRAK